MSRPASVDFTTVELVDVSRHYGRRRALARTSLAFTSGQITGLLGPNGAGKSTLLGILATLVRPTAGVVRYGESTAADLGDELRGRIGLLGHDLFLYGDLTARENLAFFGQLAGVVDVGARVDAALDAAGLRDRANDRVSSFSRGLRQRLALERALIHHPRLVLLDEPFTGLDDTSASRLARRLAGLKDQGAIVVMATHDFESADEVVDRVVCLREGRAHELPPSSGRLRDRYRQLMAEATS